MDSSISVGTVAQFVRNNQAMLEVINIMQYFALKSATYLLILCS